MEYLREQAVVSNRRIVAVMERRKQLLEYMAELEKAGVGRGYKQFESARQELAALEEEIFPTRDCIPDSAPLAVLPKRWKDLDAVFPTTFFSL